MLVAEPQYGSAKTCINGIVVVAKWRAQEVAVQYDMRDCFMMFRIHILEKTGYRSNCPCKLRATRPRARRKQRKYKRSFSFLW